MPSFLDDYEPVEDRLRAFWSEHPDGRIETELVHVGTDGYIVKASVWREDLADVGLGKTEIFRPSATGLAAEQVTERGVNSTSALENCETSAIGRALANLGYAAKGKRPSREEMSKTGSPSRETPPGEPSALSNPGGKRSAAAAHGAEGGTGEGRTLAHPSPPTTSEGRPVTGKGRRPSGNESPGEPAPIPAGRSSADPGDKTYPLRPQDCLHTVGVALDGRCLDCGAQLTDVL